MKVIVASGQCIKLIRENWVTSRLLIGFKASHSSEQLESVDELTLLQMIEDFIYCKKNIPKKPTEAAKMRLLSVGFMLEFLVENETVVKSIVDKYKLNSKDKWTKSCRYWSLIARVVADFHAVFNDFMISVHLDNGFIAEKMYFISRDLRSLILAVQIDPTSLRRSYEFALSCDLIVVHAEMCRKFTSCVLKTVDKHLGCWERDESMKFAVLGNTCRQESKSIRDMVRDWYKDYTDAQNDVILDVLTVTFTGRVMVQEV